MNADHSLRLDYEAQVRALTDLARRMQADGTDAEKIARHLNAKRRALSARFKALTPPDLRARIAARSLAVYGDEDGPTIQTLRAAGKSWDQIIAGACRPGRFPPVTPTG